jgi:hypothetical protein
VLENDVAVSFVMLIKYDAELRPPHQLGQLAVVTNGDGLAVFDLIRHKRHGGGAVLVAFDLIELDGEDLRRSSIEYRASPSIRNDRAGRAVTAATIIGKRSVKSLPWRVISRTRAPSRRAMMRMPSCLIS